MTSISDIFDKWHKKLKMAGLSVESTDFDRPWGGFFVIKESDGPRFLDTFYPGETVSDLTKGGRISPKILVVAPGKRLSWQYHHRRSEVWKVIEGRVGVKRSDSDDEGPILEYDKGDIIVLQREERHRLIGLDQVGVIAEIWQHTDPSNLSDESDIVRLQDDFGR